MDQRYPNGPNDPLKEMPWFILPLTFDLDLLKEPLRKKKT
jgi:hypothetical protein